MKRIIAIVIIAASLISASLLAFVLLTVQGIQEYTMSPQPEPEPTDPFFSGEEAPLDHGLLNVVASNTYIRDIYFHFARSRTVEPHVCIGAGVDPFTYEPSAEDEDKMLTADLVLYMGLGLEPGIERLVEKVRGKVRCESLASAILEEHREMLIPSNDYESGYDPHFWWNPLAWEQAVLWAAHILSDVDEENAYNYKSVFIHYGKSLHGYDSRWIGRWSREIAEERRVLVTLHPAFEYFGSRYGYRVMSLYTPKSPRKVTAQRRSSVADYIVKNNVPAIFPEYGFPLTELEALEAEVKKKGGSVIIAGPLYSYSLGSSGDDYLYVNVLNSMMRTIYDALKEPGDPDMPG